MPTTAARTLLARFLLPPAAVAAAVLLRWPLQPYLGNEFPFLFLYPAVVLCGGVGGLWPGLLAIALSLPASLLVTADDPLPHHPLADWIGPAVFAAVSGVLSYLFERLHRANRVAAAEQERWRTTLAGIADAVVVTDSGGRVTYLNPSAELLTGWPAGEAVGRRLGEVVRVVNDDTGKTAENPVPGVLDGGGSTAPDQHATLIARDGGRRAIEQSAGPVRAGADGVRGCVLVFRDIGDRRRAEAAVRESEARFRRLVEASPFGAAASGPDGPLTFANDAFLRTLGYARADLAAGRIRWDRITPPDMRTRDTRGQAELVKRGYCAPYQKEYVRADGRRVPVLVAAVVAGGPAARPDAVITYCVDLSDQKRAEARLRDRVEELQALLNTLPIPLMISHDPGGERVTGNRAAHDLLRVPPDRPLPGPAAAGDRPPRFVAVKDGRPLAADELPMRRAAATGQSVRDIDYDLAFDDGTVLNVYGFASPLFDTAGKVRGCVGAFVDLTERKRLERESAAWKARYEAAARSSGHVLYDSDRATGRVLYAGDCERVLGYPADDLAGPVGKWAELVHPDDREAFAGAFDLAVAAGTPFHAEYRVRRRDGEYVLVQDDGHPVYGAGGHLHLIGFVKDVTARNRMEAELRRRADELAEADRKKDVFLAMLGHELRTPLAAVRNAVGVLAGATEPGVRDRVTGVIGRQAESLTRLVDDLLDVSRLNSGKIRLRTGPVELAAVFDRAVETARPLVEARRHALTVRRPAVPVWVDADPVRLAQVFVNLLNNAAKYTDEGGRIEAAIAADGGAAAVAVRDTGVGIRADLLPRVFDLFEQVDDSADRSEGGLGLGLALVRRLVEKHGGTVEARSDGPGRGSEFVVRLPTIPPPEEPPPEADRNGATANGATGRRRVLVVDDSRDAADTLAMLLELLGHEVCAVTDGPAAVAAVGDFRPDVAFLDIGMPGMTGYDVARAVRELPAGGGLRLVALTGFGRDDDRERARAAGFDEHVVKPVDPAALPGLIASRSGSPA